MINFIPTRIRGLSTAMLFLLLSCLWLAALAASAGGLLEEELQQQENASRQLQEEAAPSKTINVFTLFREEDALLVRKQRQDLLSTSGQQANNKVVFDYNALTTEEQLSFLQENTCVEGASTRYTALKVANQTQLAEELWKYCALYFYGGLYLDSGSALLRTEALKRFLSETSNAAVLMDAFADKAIHGSLLYIHKPKSTVAMEMAKFLVETHISTLEASPLLLPRTLYQMIAQNKELNTGVNGDWNILRQFCSLNPFRRHLQGKESANNAPNKEIYNLHQCPRESGFCCFIYSNQEEALLASKNPVLPEHVISYERLPRPFPTSSSGTTNNGGYDDNELPFISTLKRTEHGKEVAPAKSKETTNSVETFYEQMKAKNCMPSQACRKCLGDKKHGATCETCLEACPCFCKALCAQDASVPSRNATAYDNIVVSKPRHARDPTRLIPRIVHQTWFEELTPEKYPNMSRMTQSFQTSGWEYNFYTDDEAGDFLEKHFPPQVREAYDTLIPGAFKADLFRYCVLLIRGGVYADVDTMMGPSLDDAIPDDVGFMVPLDEPGKKVGKRMCLWNGFIAAAPGHPFLAKAIETIVNNIRQRYTSLDMSQMHCPEPELSVITSFSPLFVAGPCMLGGSINRVLGRHGQTSFEAGELPHPDGLGIPGRTIILNQNKWDMGAHRFTNLEQNLIVLSTDFPDSDDREKLDDYEHYSNTRVKFEIYGIDGVYKDKTRSSEGMLRIQLE